MLTTTVSRRAVGLLIYTLAKGWHLTSIVPAITTLVLALTLLPTQIVTPQLLSAVPVQTPTSGVLTLVISLLIIATVPEPHDGIRALSSARRRYSPQIRVFVLTAAVITALSTLGIGDSAAVALLALTGEALVTAFVTTIRYCWAVPLLHTTAAALLGASAFGTLAPWAWILSTAPTGLGLVTSISLFIIGLMLTSQSTSPARELGLA